MLLDAAGPGDSSPSPYQFHISHSGSSRHTVYPHLLYLRHAGFATIFTRFCRFSPDFSRFLYALAPWPSGGRGTHSRNTETGGRAPARGGNAAPGGLWPPPHRAGPPARSAAAESAGGSRADRGQRDPGAERPPGGQPGRSGQRGSASTVEGTAGPGWRDRLPRTPGGPARRRGGRRVGVAARAASGRAARRPTAREKGPGREPARPAAYRDSRRPRPVRGRGEPAGDPPDQSAAPGAGRARTGGPPAQTPQAAQRRPRAGRRRD